MQTSLQFEGAYSVGTASRSQWYKTHTEQNPAPSQYNIPNFYDKPKSPKVIVGTGPRSTYGNIIDMRGFPEGGRYRIKSDIEKNSQIKMKFAKADREFTNEVYQASKIGPAYDPNDKSSKQNLPQYSFGYRFLEDPKQKTPGPNVYPREETNQYNYRRTENNWRKRTSTMEGFNYSQTRFRSTTFSIPGPGQYDPNNPNTKQGAKHKFGTQEKLAQSHFDSENFPGPGKFDPKMVIAKSNGYSLAQKLGNTMKRYETDAPGPGQHQPQLPKSNQNIKFSASKKGSIVQREDLYKPTPWTYNADKQNKQQSFLQTDSFGNAIRPPLNNTSDFPGSGTYYPADNLMDGKKWSMAAKLKEKKKQSVFFPGPGHYDPNSEFVKEKSQEVGTKTGDRTDFVYSKFKTNGPGAYDLNSTVKEKQPVKYTIGNQQRFKPNKQYEPGPGSYDIRGTIGNIPNYLQMAKRKDQQSLMLNMNTALLFFLICIFSIIGWLAYANYKMYIDGSHKARDKQAKHKRNKKSWDME